MDYKFHIAKVVVRTYEYMSDFSDSEKLHTVDADTKEEAEDKINAFYESKSSPYGTSYNVMSIEFFEHIF